MFLNIIILLFGLTTLVIGADLLVKKAVFMAHRMRVDPFIMGVIILGMGTSLPEWAVSTLSFARDLPDLAISNILGSNIFNILLVLGLVFLRPISIKNIQLVKKEVVFLFLASLFLVPIMYNHFLSRLDSIVLIIIFLVYLGLTLISFKKPNFKKPNLKNKNKTGGLLKEVELSSSSGVHSQNQPKTGGLLKEVALLLLGLALLMGGSHFTVNGASALGYQLGVSERLMGILVVSIGTGLPELTASLVSILKGYKSMAFGNVIGSNIFNTFIVLGTAALVRPSAFDSQLFTIDFMVLLVVYMVLLFIVFFPYKILQKLIPYLFFSGYLFYVIFVCF